MSKNHWPPIIPHTGWKTSSATHHPNTTIFTTAPPGRYKRMAFLTTSSTTTATTTIFSSSLYFAFRVVYFIAQLVVYSTQDMIVCGGYGFEPRYETCFFFFSFLPNSILQQRFLFESKGEKHEKKNNTSKHEHRLKVPTQTLLN